MLYTYPSNRLENLVVVLDTLMNSIERSSLAVDTVLVQHPGMQHWLSMALAGQSQQKLCMNIDYPLPVRYFWDLIRMILGPDAVPERSVYTREILVWRLYHLLQQPGIINDPLMQEPNRYWQAQPDYLQDNRRFQLAEQLADLYEQYLMYRPEWIDHWEQSAAEHWQALLWKALVAENPNHPLALMKQASRQLHQPVTKLPEHFFVFGINSLAPVWLDFLRHLAHTAGTDIHLLYLNPSDEHWDQLSSEKQTLKQHIVQQRAEPRATWMGQEPDLSSEAGTPLLTSLGQQGQAFVRLLSERADYEAHAFTPPEPDSLLHRLQLDLLTLNDARNDAAAKSIDGSVQITSTHSAFREVQGLHDWLLHQFNDDPTLTPKDVLVMCPNVEDYAPFVHAVFSRSFADLSEDIPPLPCSIADRNLKDADPTVAAFLELLTLPDTRFEVSRLLSWLRIPAIADKFALTPDDLQRITHWLERANVHWGLDAQHKQQWMNTETTQHFTWKQGLDRLLLGFAYGDEDSYVNGEFLLHDVEGAEAQVLGKLTAIIEQLQNIRSDLTRPRTPAAWQQYLIEQLQIALLSTQSEYERSNQSILKAINDLTEFANRAGLTETDLPLAVVRYVLENAFASPEQTGSQFMTGQITVCSMVPMRSIPFRVVAILGLNDGEFPRNRPPLGFDLMAQQPARLGDRSRRGDDRYLFLEALLSARDHLYLSYQGYDIRKNEPRPPSLVLEELFSYLQQGYGFNRDQDIRQLPLQPFSPKNYQGRFPSFNDHWAHLTTQQDNLNASNDLPATTDLKNHGGTLNDWHRFFSHPARAFCEQRLGLYLHETRMDLPADSEPFALNLLDRYQLQTETVRAVIQGQSPEQLIDQARAASAFPLSDLAETTALDWQQQATSFSQLLIEQGIQQLEMTPVTFDSGDWQLSGMVPLIDNDRVLTWRLANAKGKDILHLWLLHLLANHRQPAVSTGLYRGKDEQIEQIQLQPVTDAGARLRALHDTWLQGMQQPLPLHCDWLPLYLTDPDNEKKFHSIWDDSFNARGLRYDPYMQFCFRVPPDFAPTMAAMDQTYAALKAVLSQSILEEGLHD